MKDASTDEATIRGWWERWPEANVGIRTGKESKVVVIDLDRRHGGEESLKGLEERYGTLPETVSARTGGGGLHLFFAHPGGTVKNKVQVAGLPGLDVRGDGGYIVAPPSKHVSGTRYEWQAGRDPEHRAPAPMPEWLSELLRVSTHRRGPARRPEEWRKLVAEGAVEGIRNVTVASLAGHLLYHGVPPSLTVELLQAWNDARNRPPLPAGEVAQVVESIAEREQRRRQEGKEDE